MIPLHCEPLYQCVPNFSEGRRSNVIGALATAVRGTAGAVLADCSSDPDHNRTVLTILGTADSVCQAVSAAAAVAVARIDLCSHEGVHPRMGAIDVVPVVPLSGANREGAVEVASRIAGVLATELRLPVYLYEWSATGLHSPALPEIRRGGFEGLSAHSLTGLRAPDIGPDAAHATAGAAVVGARAPLVAYNIWLASESPDVALGIARDIRRERSFLRALTGVRALGFYLATRRQAQVSMNLTRPAETTMKGIFEYVRARSGELGVAVSRSEVVGLTPHGAIGAPPGELLWLDYHHEKELETWVRRMRTG